jgi:Holliday junction DNA helicase RuvA
LIGKITGEVDIISSNNVIIDVNGIGYQIYCSGKTLAQLKPGELCKLLIETHVREDHIHLYGFVDKAEKSTFTILQSVKGVGTKMALSILSSMSCQDIQLALSTQNKDAFCIVSGVGKKLGERIITELKDKFISDINLSDNALSATSASAISENNISSDAIYALISLGISRQDAAQRVGTILAQDNSAPISEIIRLALKN